MEVRKIRETVNLFTNVQVAFPINKNGDSINIGITVTLDSYNNESSHKFIVYTGIDSTKNKVYDGTSYEDCHKWIENYLADKPVVKHLRDWFDDFYGGGDWQANTMAWPRRWFSKLNQHEQQGYYTRKEANEFFEKEILVPKNVFFEDPEKYKPQ